MHSWWVGCICGLGLRRCRCCCCSCLRAACTGVIDEDNLVPKFLLLLLFILAVFVIACELSWLWSRDDFINVFLKAHFFKLLVWEIWFLSFHVGVFDAIRGVRWRCIRLPVPITVVGWYHRTSFVAELLLLRLLMLPIADVGKCLYVFFVLHRDLLESSLDVFDCSNRRFLHPLMIQFVDEVKCLASDVWVHHEHAVVLRILTSVTDFSVGEV